MSHYIDGFIIPVPKANLDAYRDIAERACAIWKEHGALSYCECVGDDLDPMEGEGTPRSFPDIVGAEPDETVMFSWAVFASRESRDAANEKIMNDPRTAALIDPPLFDCSRMAFGGFREIVRG